MTTKTISTTRDDEIVTAYEQGQSLRAIGAAHNISGERVRQVLAARGVTRRNVGGVTKHAYEAWAAQNGDKVEQRLRSYKSAHEAIEALSAKHPKTWVRRLLRERIAREEWSTYSQRINHYDTKTLLTTLRRYAQHDTLSAKRYNDSRVPGDPSFTTYVLRFGSWGEACRQAGLNVSARTSPAVPNWSIDELYASVSTYLGDAKRQGQTPTRNGYEVWRKANSTPLPSAATLRVRTGKSWTALLRDLP